MRNGSGRGAPIGMLLAGMALVALMVGACADTKPPFQAEACTRGDLGGESVARVWDEQTLQLIREVVPAPTVHARNLFHISAAMWDAWAAYDPDRRRLLRDREAHGAATWTAARDEAISYAAYRVLSARYGTASGRRGAGSRRSSPRRMDQPVLPGPISTTTDGDSPAAVGNRIAAAVIAFGLDDGVERGERLRGARLQAGQRPARGHRARHDHERSRTAGSRSQLDSMISQNGIPIPGTGPAGVGPHWGHVDVVRAAAVGATACRSTRARRRGSATRRPTRRTRTRRVEVIRDSSALDAERRVTIDISPAARWQQHAGHQRRHGPRRQPGHRPAVRAGRREAGRLRPGPDGVLGRRPKSETPPGHWNVIANTVADEPGPSLQIGGKGHAGRSAGVGRQALPRAQRRGPRRGDRGVGPQGLLRLRPARSR